MLRILIEGAQGQLGHELTDLLASGISPLGALPSAYEGAVVDAVDYQELDITDEDALVRWFDGHEPYDYVFNCAAMTNVDGCESNEAQAFALNAAAPAFLAAQCARTGAVLIHISTDYVFEGSQEIPRKETDPVHPLSAYGRSKLAGEWAVYAHCLRSHIVRTAWLYGRQGKNFVKTMLSLGATHDKVTVVNDQWGNPTNAADLAYELLAIALTDDFGIWHCTGEGVCNWAQFAQTIMDDAHIDCTVVPCTSEEYKALNPRSAWRPSYSSLENARLAATIGNKMRPWEVALADYIEHEGAPAAGSGQSAGER